MNYSIEYIKMWPAGNTTVLVTTRIPRSLYSEVACKILKEDKSVEQVGFIERPQSSQALARLQMMGGEFCGNATRSLAFYLYNKMKEDCNIEVKGFDLEVSGTDKLIHCAISDKGDVEISLPVAHYGNDVVKEFHDGKLFKLDGISHFVTQMPEFAKKQPDLLKLYASQIIQQEGLAKLPAAGVIFTEKTEKGLCIEPIIWVKDTSTLIHETSCASGTLAVGMNEALSVKDGTIVTPILQPSGLPLVTTITKKKGKFEKASISGPVLQKEANSSEFSSPHFLPEVAPALRFTLRPAI